MRNIRLRGKLAILVGLLVATVAVVAVVGAVQLSRVNTTVQELVDVSGKTTLIAYDLRVGLLSSVRAEKNAVITTDNQRATEFTAIATEANDRIGRLIPELKDLLSLAASDQQRSDFEEFRRAWDAFLVNQQEVLRLAVQNTNSKASDLTTKEIHEITERVRHFLTRILDNMRMESFAANDPAQLQRRVKTMESAFLALNYAARLPDSLYEHINSRSDLRMQQLDQEITTSLQALRSSLEEIRGRLPEEERGELGRLTGEVENLQKLATNIQELSHANTDLVASNLTLTKTVELASKCDSALEQLIKNMRTRMERDRTATAASYQRALAMTGGAGILGTAIAIVLAGLVARSITVPLARGVALANTIASGDLTQRLRLNQRDEIGQLATALDSAADSFSQIISDICRVSDKIGGSAQSLTSVSHQMLSQSEEMSIQAGNVAGGTEQMTNNINTMAAAAEQMSMNVMSISSASEQTSVNVARISSAADTTARKVATVVDAIQDASRSFESIAAEARDGARVTQEAAALAGTATQTMSALDRSAGEISKVTEMIKLIAMQTNLLALNATIEATSAGEAGKGFAVVASEIKELASQSGKAAEGIAAMIEGIQTNTRDAVAVIQKVAETISATNTASGRIRQAVDQVARNAQESAANLRAANEGVENIATSIAEVAKGATDASRNAGEASKAASDVSRNASEAARSVRDISSNIQGVSQATKENTQSAHEVNRSAAELQQIAGDLQAAVRRFHLDV